MKRKALLLSTLPLIIIILTAEIFVGDGSPSISKNRLMIALRSVGHQLLLRDGDVTSRVFPVKKLGDGIFQLEFQNKFSMVPDTLVATVTRQLQQQDIANNYMVNVFDCSSHENVYGFEINPLNKNTVPCLGRSLPRNCYTIQVAFLDYASTTNRTPYYIYAASGVYLTFILFVFLPLGKRKSVKIESDNSLKLGSYSFYPDHRLLKNENETIELSAKESKLLKLFAAHLNQLVTRDQLLKEVWEDEGVFTGRSLDMFVSKLRKKLKNDPCVNFVNTHGVGYTLQIIEQA